MDHESSFEEDYDEFHKRLMEDLGKGNKSLTQFLIKSGADVNFSQAGMAPPLQLAANRRCESLVRILIKAGAIIVNAPQKSGAFEEAAKSERPSPCVVGWSSRFRYFAVKTMGKSSENGNKCWKHRDDRTACRCGCTNPFISIIYSKSRG